MSTSCNPAFQASRSVLLTLALAGWLNGCGDASGGSAGSAQTTESLAAAGDTVAQSPASEPAGPISGLPPNELGQVMVLEYHRLGEPENDYYRSLENFRNDLRNLYAAGYRPITLRDLVQGNINVPFGTTPVVFTFDDSSQGQFYYLPDGSIDPNTMVGVWDSFAKENSGWSNGATWCVLPASEHPSNFFGERPSKDVPRAEREATIRRKVDYLVSHGHEICNHTLYHARLDRAVNDAQVQEFIGRGEDSIRVYLPEGYKITTLALPLGMWPRNHSLAFAGTYNGKPYRYEAVLEVTGGPDKSPFHKEFDPHSINRVVMHPGFLDRHVEGYAKNPERRFVSDGDPRVISVPPAMADSVDRNRWKDLDVRVVDGS